MCVESRNKNPFLPNPFFFLLSFHFVCDLILFSFSVLFFSYYFASLMLPISYSSFVTIMCIFFSHQHSLSLPLPHMAWNCNYFMYDIHNGMKAFIYNPVSKIHVLYEALTWLLIYVFHIQQNKNYFSVQAEQYLLSFLNALKSSGIVSHSLVLGYMFGYIFDHNLYVSFWEVENKDDWLLFIYLKLDWW